MVTAKEAIMSENFQIVTTSSSVKPTAWLFFAGNLIPPAVMARVPQWAHGGIVLPETATLRHVGGYVRRCEITEMRQHMEAVAASNIQPELRDRYIRQYTIKVGGETISVGGRGYDNHLLFSPVYPSQELPRLVGRMNGIVEMPVSGAEEALAAQLFLFPDWDEILSGAKKLPVKIKELKEYFVSRKKHAGSNQIFQAVADAAVLSCDRFEAAGREEIARQTEEYLMAEKKGIGWAYGADAELYFEQLDVGRRDSLVQQQADKFDRLEEALLKYAQTMAAAMQPKAPSTQVSPAPAAPEIVENKPAPVAAPKKSGGNEEKRRI